MMATPAITGKMIIIRGESHVFGIGEKVQPEKNRVEQ
jgi:hypothetical protein